MTTQDLETELAGALACMRDFPRFLYEPVFAKVWPEVEEWILEFRLNQILEQHEQATWRDRRSVNFYKVTMPEARAARFRRVSPDKFERLCRLMDEKLTTEATECAERANPNPEVVFISWAWALFMRVGYAGEDDIMRDADALARRAPDEDMYEWMWNRLYEADSLLNHPTKLTRGSR